MTALDALRRGDPARHLPPHALDDHDEALLRSILEQKPSGESTPALPAAPPRRRPGRDWNPALVTVVVAAAVVAGSVLAIRAVSIPPHAGPAASRTPTSRSALEDAVFGRLDEVAGGGIPVRQKSALTWTDRAPGADGGAIDLSGKDLYIAAACDGGGAIAISETGRSPVDLRCDSRSVVGPIDLTARATDGGQTAGLTVDVTAGHPRYVAKAMAFPAVPSIPTPSG